MNTARKNEISTDYAALVARLRSGETVECAIDVGLWNGTADATYTKKWWGDLFTLFMGNKSDVLRISSEREFISFCRDNSVWFDESR